MRFILGLSIGLFLTSSSFAGDFIVKSSGFQDKGTIPNNYTCEAGNHSPELSWTNPPVRTQSFAILLTSLDTPLGLLYNWVVFNIPKDTKNLRSGMKNLPEGSVIGQNSFHQNRYRGPCPIDNRLHRYEITIYALDTDLQAPESAEPEEVVSEMESHIISKAKLSGVFSH